MTAKKPSYRWEGSRRVSVEDGAPLLKTPEAARLLGVSVEFVRGLIRSGRLPVRATYSIGGFRQGWLVSERDVLPLASDPEVAAAAERYRGWLAARSAPARKGPKPLPEIKLRPLKKKKKIRPDSFQVRAVEIALSGTDVLVAAPTGAGKTWIAEELARRAAADGAGFVYASPLKALSNQKYSDFAAAFGESAVGLVTGDITNNPGAPLLVMTTEIFRNKCLASPWQLSGVRWAVMDEFHLLDSDRGSAWEEAVIFAPPHVVMVYLSATVPNHEEIARWIAEAREKEVETVVSGLRPVPLDWRWFIDGRVYTEKTAGSRITELVEQQEERRYRRFFRRYAGWGDYYDEDWEDEDWEDEDWEDEDWEDEDWEERGGWR